MTGFNHYTDCTCGWCVNYGRMSGSERRRLESDMPRRDAVRELKQASARSISGCFVNPNAKCPVCGDGVFFYANEHGSRVFFDDLGPPWPKHPCTDIPREYVPASRTPIRRTRGSMQELISAANVAGLFANKVFGRRAPDEWAMLVVIAVDRAGNDNTVTAEFLDSREGETTTFSCHSELPVLDTGDFINMKGDQISFVHRDLLWPITFTTGGAIQIPSEAPPDPVPTPSTDPPKEPSPPKGRLVRPVERKKQESWGPMTESEMIHFNSEAVSLGDLFAKLEPIVKAYAREYTRKPPDVSRRLNADGHRTAAGDTWTPRLVRFLLALMFNDSSTTAKPVAIPKRASGRRTDRSKEPPVAMGDKDEIARRLSSLGRVTITKNVDRSRESEL
ncbi:MAG: hypothetical protein J0H40_22015 [Rhizobiales bacterium]|nr:hypothetical protein [Hyphomicrobiales bacterium]